MSLPESGIGPVRAWGAFSSAIFPAAPAWSQAPHFLQQPPAWSPPWETLISSILYTSSGVFSTSHTKYGVNLSVQILSLQITDFY